MKLKDLNNDFTLDGSLSYRAMNQGLFLEFETNDVPTTSNVLNLPSVDTYPNVPIYIKNNSNISGLIINANQSDEAQTIEGSESIVLNPGEYTILQGVRKLNSVDYWTTEKSTVGARPYQVLAIQPNATGGGIFSTQENSTGETFNLTSAGTGSYVLGCTSNSSFFTNKHLVGYVAGRRYVVIEGGTPDAVDVKCYDATDILADFGSGSTVLNQVEFRFYPK